jgi:glycerophosphoryl diester phosphodiesterase
VTGPHPNGPHPDSVAPRPGGGTVALKVHRAIWSGTLPGNSLAAIAETCAAQVARAEIDVQPRRDGGFVVFHDDHLDRSTDATGEVRVLGSTELARARLRWQGETTAFGLCDLGDALAAIAAAPYPTVFELDLKELEPWPWPRVEAFVRLIEPVRDRVLLGTAADWNLRRILTVDPAAPVSLNPGAYLDWTAADEGVDLPRGAYGYLDRHPLAARRLGPVREYLADRFGGIARLVPGTRELHLRLAFFERMLDDGVHDAAALIRSAGPAVDVWTLDAGSPRWEERLRRVIAAGVDVVATNTAPALAAAARRADPARSGS